MSNIPKPKVISYLFSVFTILCPLLLSYPFFILYIIVCLPYILQILSFLSPVTTTILFIVILSILIHRSAADFYKDELGFPQNASLPDQEKTIPKIDEGDEILYPDEVHEMYKIVFETFIIDGTCNIIDNLEEHPDEKILQAVESAILNISQNNEAECKGIKHETFTSSMKEDSLDDGQLERFKSVVKERLFEELIKDVCELEYMDRREVDKSSDKQKIETEMVKAESIKRRHSRRKSSKTNIDFIEDGGGIIAKQENECENTLACKLLEDKHSNDVEGTQGMDLLWETHEEKTCIVSSNNEVKNENEESEGYIIGYFEDKEDEEEIDVQVCCLHAFKFSGAKMNMGVGGRNLSRISKVVKGIRWLRRGVTKHGKKMNNNEEKRPFYK